MNWKDVSEIVHNVVVASAALIGGTWVLFRFLRERTDEAALDLDVSLRSIPLGSEHLVALCVDLTNRGKTRIRAKAERTKDGLAFDDGIERLRFSGSLQIRKVIRSDSLPPCRVDWFDGPPVESLPTVPDEINLFIEYEDPTRDNIVDFWLEPAERYRLETPLVLPPGVYIGKVTFIAAGADTNFWSRVFCFPVPLKA